MLLLTVLLALLPSTQSQHVFGEVVTELDKAILHVYQARNGDYWFGGNGAYRYHGKTLVRYTTKDGLMSNRVGGFQEDQAGNIYLWNDGVSKFDGKTFTKLPISTTSAKSDWKLQPDDLWFVGGQDSGLVYRWDGRSLHPLAFPATPEGDKHFREMPRDKFPNAKYSPYDVYSIFKDTQGYLWFGTATLGACRYDGKTFLWIPERELQNGSFGTRAIIEDSAGKIWSCSTLHRYEVDSTNPAEPKFKKLAGLTKDTKTAAVDGIMSSLVDKSGVWWMATYGMGVWRYDGKNLTHFPVKDGGKDIHLFSIHLDRQGTLWLGTQQSGPFRFNGKTFEKFKP
jgi:ligand-binding sensor domain-containing protein